MKTIRIKGHGGLKMLDFNSPNKTLVYASPAALIPLRNSNTAIHRLWLFFGFWLTTCVAMGSPVAMVTDSFIWLTCKFTSKAYPKELSKTSWWKCFTALPLLVKTNNKIRTRKYHFFSIHVHKSGQVPSVVVHEGIQYVSHSLLMSLVEYTSASFGEISRKARKKII